MIPNIDINEVITRGIKYLVEGLVVAIVAFYIPKRKMVIEEIAMLAITAAASLAVLDLMAPSIGAYARFGTGFGIGSTIVGTSL